MASQFAGLILAVPFGAVMATVSSYLVVLSSAVVRDLYQRFVNPHADRSHLRIVAWCTMIFAGDCQWRSTGTRCRFLQAFIVFSTSNGGNISGSRSDGLLLATSQRQRHSDEYAHRGAHGSCALLNRNRTTADAGTSKRADIVPADFPAGF